MQWTQIRPEAESNQICADNGSLSVHSSQTHFSNCACTRDDDVAIQNRVGRKIIVFFFRDPHAKRQNHLAISRDVVHVPNRYARIDQFFLLQSASKRTTLGT